MRARLVVVTVLSLVVLATAWVVAAGPSGRTGPNASSPRLQQGTDLKDVDGAESDEGGEGEVETAPEDWYLSQRVASGAIPAGAPERARQQADTIAAASLRQDAPLAAARWVAQGPTNIGGRVIDAVADPAHAGTVFVAAATGGVWRATDTAMTFSPVWPSSNPQSLGALAVTPDGSTLFAGTGEAGPGGGSLTYGGKGIYRSTDDGATWQNVGLRSSGATGRIVVDPTNSQRIFVAAAGNLFVPGGQRGVYRSTDGGTTWTKVLAGANGTTGAVDLAIDPSNPQRVYATMWDHIRHPDLRVYGGVGSGVYRSTDGGTTWARLSNGLPAPSADVGRIGVAVAPTNPMHLYAMVIDASGDFTGLYTSTDGGDSWTKQPTSGNLSGSQATYGWWFGRLWVDPANENHAWAAGVTLEETTNGGGTWNAAALSVHADQHAMAWDPTTPGRIYLGNDGGLYRNDTGGSGTWVHAVREPWNQFYSVDVSEQDASRMVGGAQDNSVLRSYGGTGWNSIVGGDGEEALIDPADQNDVYGCSQYGACLRSTNGGTTLQSFGFMTSSRFNWFTPVQFDPTNTAVMYAGGNILSRSTDRAAHWTAISPDLTGGPGPDPNYPFGTITTVAASATNPNEVFAATDDGRVWFTTDLGAHWTRATDPSLPTTWVSRVAVDPSDALVAYATFSGYRGGDQAPHVFRTADGGTTWTNISGNLPNAPVNDVVVSGSTLLVATDVGVFRSGDGGATWTAVGTGMPNVPVDDIELRVTSNQLFAATFGRGIYAIVLS